MKTKVTILVYKDYGIATIQHLKEKNVDEVVKALSSGVDPVEAKYEIEVECPDTQQE